MVIVLIAFVTLFSSLATTSPIVPRLNTDCYARPGDLYLAAMLRVTARGEPGDPAGSRCGSRLHSLYRLQYVESFVYAIDAVNHDASLLPNITLGFVVVDTCGVDLAALALATHFLRNDGNYTRRPLDGNCSNGPPEVPIAGVVGPATSREAVLVASLLSAFQIPLIGTTATSDELSDKTRFEYFLRLVPPDKFQVEAILDLLVHFNWTFASMLYSEGSYGESAAKTVSRGAKARGLCLPLVDMLALDVTSTDMGYHVGRLEREKNARVVILFLQLVQLELLFREVLEAGLSGWFVWVSGDAMVSSDFGRAADGAFIMQHVLPTVTTFSEHYLSLTPSNRPEDPWIRRHWELLYDCTWDTTVTGQSNGSQTSCFPYRDVPNYDQPTASYVSFYIDGVYAFAHALHALISERCPAAFGDPALLDGCIDGPSLLLRLRAISFTGIGGDRIRFDANGDMLGRFSIQQYISGRSPKKREVALWDKERGQLDIDLDHMDWTVFSGSFSRATPGFASQNTSTEPVPESVCSKPCADNEYILQRGLPCCWQCHRCRSNERVNENRTSCELCAPLTWPDPSTASRCLPIEPTFAGLTDTSTIALTATAALGVVGTLSVGGWYGTKWNHKLIKASSRELTSILLVGILIAYATVFAFFLRPSLFSCTLARYGFFVSVTLIYAPLTVKTSRIFRIFSAGKRGSKKPALISNRSQLLFTVLLVTLQGAMSVWSGLLAPPVAKRRMPVATEKFVELSCDLPLLAILPPLALNLLLVCACAFFGFLTRGLPENFSESWYIFVSVATTLFLWLVFLPVYFTAFYAAHQAALLASCLLINATVTVVCIFVPKIYAVYFVDDTNMKVSSVTTATAVSAVQN